MAEIVNLRLARKRKARTAKEQTADENRVRHGRSGPERELERARLAREAALLDAHRRNKDDDNGRG